MAAAYFFRRLPANFLAFALRMLWRLALRLDVVGLDTVAKSGARNIIAVNHVSFLDAPIVLSLLDDAPGSPSIRRWRRTGGSDRF